MSNIINICVLRFKLLIRGAVLTLPTIILLGFLWIMYHVPPISVSSSFVLSAVFLFFVCLFISLGMNGKEDDIFEETLLLHCRSTANYYIARELLLFAICFVFSLVLTLFPAIWYLTHKSFFERAMIPIDVILGGANILVCGLAGTQIGDLFHPRVISKRRDALLFATLLSILTICKFGLIEFNPLFKALNYLLPPVLDAYKMVAKDCFETKGMLLICLHLLIYSVVILLIKMRLLTLKKYRY